MTLADADLNRTLKIVQISQYCQELLDQGFSPESECIKLHSGFFGSPIACRINGAKLALTGKWATQITVEYIN